MNKVPTDPPSQIQPLIDLSDPIERDSSNPPITPVAGERNIPDAHPVDSSLDISLSKRKITPLSSRVGLLVCRLLSVVSTWARERASMTLLMLGEQAYDTGNKPDAVRWMNKLQFHQSFLETTEDEVYERFKHLYLKLGGNVDDTGVKLPGSKLVNTWESRKVPNHWVVIGSRDSGKDGLIRSMADLHPRGNASLRNNKKSAVTETDKESGHLYIPGKAMKYGTFNVSPGVWEHDDSKELVQVLKEADQITYTVSMQSQAYQEQVKDLVDAVMQCRKHGVDLKKLHIAATFANQLDADFQDTASEWQKGIEQVLINEAGFNQEEAANFVNERMSFAGESTAVTGHRAGRRNVGKGWESQLFPLQK